MNYFARLGVAATFIGLTRNLLSEIELIEFIVANSEYTALLMIPVQRRVER